jgi:hypothetical protein
MKAGTVALPLYLISGVLILLPVLDVLAQVFPPPAMTRHWRFGAVGLVSERLLFPLLGLTIAVSVAVLRQHAATLRFLALMSLGSTVVGLILVADFALNSIQTWGGTPESARSSVAVMAAVALVKLLAGLAVLWTLGLIGWRNHRSIRKEARARAPLARAPVARNEPVGA